MKDKWETERDIEEMVRALSQSAQYKPEHSGIVSCRNPADLREHLALSILYPNRKRNIINCSEHPR